MEGRAALPSVSSFCLLICHVLHSLLYSDTDRVCQPVKHHAGRSHAAPLSPYLAPGQTGVPGLPCRLVGHLGASKRAPAQAAAGNTPHNTPPGTDLRPLPAVGPAARATELAQCSACARVRP